MTTSPQFPMTRSVHARAACTAAALAIVLAMGISCAFAQSSDYPTRPVRWVVGFAAGGSSDIVARLMSDWLQERLGEAFLVENRPGAGSNLAAEAVVNAPPDGYTLLSVTSANAINATVNKKSLPFDIVKQIAPVAGTARGPNVMVVHPSIPATTVAEFIGYAKANPGKINMGSAGVGTTSHLAGELFKAMAGVDLVHVPYRGSAPALTDLVGGQVQAMFDAMITTLPHIQAGKLRALGVTTATRLAGAGEPAGDRRERARLRGCDLVRCRRAAGHVDGDRAHAQSRDECGTRRAEDHRAARRARRHADRREPGGVRNVRAVRDRQMGDCDQGLRDQGGLTPAN
jgi:tripartite-type tricarboxylate transporter receptor subunit TctC